MEQAGSSLGSYPKGRWFKSNSRYNQTESAVTLPPGLKKEMFARSLKTGNGKMADAVYAPD